MVSVVLLPGAFAAMPLHVGTKDALYDHLHRLGRELHEPPADFLIR